MFGFKIIHTSGTDFAYLPVRRVGAIWKISCAHAFQWHETIIIRANILHVRVSTTVVRLRAGDDSFAIQVLWCVCSI